MGAYVIQMNGGTIAWSSKKQSTVAQLTCEAEYMGYSEAASQLLWTKQLLMDLRADTNLPDTRHQSSRVVVRQQPGC